MMINSQIEQLQIFNFGHSKENYISLAESLEENQVLLSLPINNYRNIKVRDDVFEEIIGLLKKLNT